MKTIRLLALIFFAVSFAGVVSAQTADEIISKYVQAIGGQERLKKITSVYTEGTIDVMGMQGTVKAYTLNGKGARQDMDINGSVITYCYTDKGGWNINPMMGGTSAEDMPKEQYDAGKENIAVGGSFIDFAAKGFKAELLGQDSVAGMNTWKIKVTSPDSISVVYNFDTNTYYIIRSTEQSEMQGQMIENIITLSDYRTTDGYTMPFKMDMSMAGGQFNMVMVFTKVELDTPIDEKMFAKPQ